MRFLILLFVITFVVAASSVQADQRFFASLYDVPVMSGLEEVPEMALNYDKGQGRVARASALYADKDITRVYRFYSQSLPQFGWKKVSDNSYLRENERLSITREWVDEAWLVTFAIEPQS